MQEAISSPSAESEEGAGIKELFGEKFNYSSHPSIEAILTGSTPDSIKLKHLSDMVNDSRTHPKSIVLTTFVIDPIDYTPDSILIEDILSFYKSLDEKTHNTIYEEVINRVDTQALKDAKDELAIAQRLVNPQGEKEASRRVRDLKLASNRIKEKAWSHLYTTIANNYVEKGEEERLSEEERTEIIDRYRLDLGYLALSGIISRLKDLVKELEMYVPSKDAVLLFYPGDKPFVTLSVALPTEQGKRAKTESELSEGVNTVALINYDYKEKQYKLNLSYFPFCDLHDTTSKNQKLPTNPTQVQVQYFFEDIATRASEFATPYDPLDASTNGIRTIIEKKQPLKPTGTG
ncbi:MAG: hypothetical protein U9O94_10995 [Nanoarchaeota archaeon]|nr:hypothetical protein [Nanoarchaeota archaeon]